jgi:hypothetical protein
MKQSVMAGLLFLLGSTAIATPATQKPETLAEMKVRAAVLPPNECVRLCAGIARQAVAEAKDQYGKDADDEGKLLLQDVESYAEKATNAAIQTKKHEKQLEIDLRDISHHLEALKRDLSFEDQPTVDAAMRHLEKLRTRLLESMFGKGKR